VGLCRTEQVAYAAVYKEEILVTEPEQQVSQRTFNVPQGAGFQSVQSGVFNDSFPAGRGERTIGRKRLEWEGAIAEKRAIERMPTT
jgi:hypothetical protein